MNPEELFLYDKIPYSTKLYKDVFAQKVIRLAQEVGTNPNYLMMVMFFEPHLKPSFTISTGSATGLFPIVESKAKEMGSSTAQLRHMGAIEQLEFLHPYIMERMRLGDMGSLVEVFLAIYYPAAVGKSSGFPVRMAKRWRNSYRFLPINEFGNIPKRDIEIAMIQYFVKYHGYNE